jgi:hypothetical protein
VFRRERLKDRFSEGQEERRIEKNTKKLLLLNVTKEHLLEKQL